MKIKSITVLLVCWLLFSLAVPAIGRQCPDCPTCSVSTGPPKCKCVCAPGSECDCEGKTCPPCHSCRNCGCECDITVNSVSSNKDVTCVGCNVTFTANVTGSCSCVDWSGGGDPATASDTCSFTTHWDTPGVKTVTATPDCGDSKQKQVTIVKVDKIQYYDDYTSSYIDMPNPLYVVKGQSVFLKVIKDPSDASWPSGKPIWGGTAGLSGTGEQKVLNVATVSSSSTD